MPKKSSIVVITATNTDMFSGTDLERAPGPGLLELFLASTVSTATVTVTLGGENIARAVAIVLRANGMPSKIDDAPIIHEAVVGGEKLLVNVGGTTGTVYGIAEHTPAEEL